MWLGARTSGAHVATAAVGSALAERAGLGGSVAPPVRRTLPGEREQVACARDFVTRAVGCCPMLDEAVLLTSELCTNTLQHTASGRGGSFEGTGYSAHDSLRGGGRDDGSKTIPTIPGIDRPSADRPG